MKRKVEIKDIDRFKPKLYADLYIPSWVNGYSVAMEYVYNWFLSKFDNGFFRTIHIVGKHPFDDFRRFEYGDYIKREKPALSIGANIEFESEFDNIDIHQFGIDGYLKKTDYHRSFFKDPVRKLYIGHVSEAMTITFPIRMRFDTKAEQLDVYNRMRIVFRIGCTETIDTDIDYHVPYELMASLAKDVGFSIGEDGRINYPYKFLIYLNRYSQIPFMYKLRYINGHHEFFIRMNNMPLHLNTTQHPNPDDGEQEGQTSSNYHIDFEVKMILPVPKFYVYYAEWKSHTDVHISPSKGVTIYSMRVFDIPEANHKGWVQYGTSNYLKDSTEKYVKEIDIDALFRAPVDRDVDVSLSDLIDDAVNIGISPDAFIDIQVYTNDLAVSKGKLPSSVDWTTRKIILPDNVVNSYFYLVIYVDRLYVNTKIIDINGLYKTRSRITNSKKHDIQDDSTYIKNSKREIKPPHVDDRY